MNEIVLVIIVLVLLAMLISGIYSLVKYKKTKQRKFLIIGLILTFVVVGLLTLFVLAFIIESTITYMPFPSE